MGIRKIDYGEYTLVYYDFTRKTLAGIFDRPGLYVADVFIKKFNRLSVFSSSGKN
jgi:hypothetical protein